MECKPMEGMNGGRATSSAHAPASASSGGSSTNEGTWWRWTHGKSGSISSSSDGVSSSASSSVGYTASASHSTIGDLSSSSTVPSWETMRWQKRTVRTGVQREETSSLLQPSLSSSSSKLFSSTASSSSSAHLGNTGVGCSRVSSASLARKKLGQSSLRNARESSMRKRISTASVIGSHDHLPRESRLSAAAPAASSHTSSLHTEIRWTPGPSKRKIVKKEKRPHRPSSLPQSRNHGVHHTQQHAWLDRPHSSSAASGLTLDLDVHMLEEKPASCLSPTSTASTISSTTSFASSSSSNSFFRPDPLVRCARAVLEDCIRQRYADNRTLRKRTLEERTKTDAGENRYFSARNTLSKSPDGCGLSCGSSSSDDELSQLEVSRNSDDKSDRDSESKMTREELYRQLMLGNYDLSSSPDFESYSPLIEEKGLPAEVRYQLPLALGTANETDKECTICQIRYGIGDHIVTLPCQHFFHACCVDRWLWNHTSCPLCRVEVKLDADLDQANLKHQFTECSQLDQETIRRKMRSSSHSAGFRPVVPEVDQLHSQLAGMSLQEESTETSEVKYLVCPTPKRPQRK